MANQIFDYTQDATNDTIWGRINVRKDRHINELHYNTSSICKHPEAIVLWHTTHVLHTFKMNIHP